jgi:hypothetical protein
MITPQQADFIAYYFDPKSETYCNAKNSALKAGYAEEYANNITGQMPKWLSDSLGEKKRLIEKAKKKLEVFLESEDEKVAQDTTKFILKTIGKDEGFSERTEHTGKDGKDLIPQPILDVQEETRSTTE